MVGGLLLLGACGQKTYDPRGLEHDETLLFVSATGQTETRPDQAQFQAGINTWAKTAEAASAANLEKIGEIVTALKQLGIPEKDIQTRAVNVQRVEWGDRKGQFQVSNIVNLTARKVDVRLPLSQSANQANAAACDGSGPQPSANGSEFGYA